MGCVGRGPSPCAVHGCSHRRAGYGTGLCGAQRVEELWTCCASGDPAKRRSIISLLTIDQKKEIPMHGFLPFFSPQSSYCTMTSALFVSCSYRVGDSSHSTLTLIKEQNSI